MTDYQKWLERVDNLLQVQRDRCLDLISANFTRRELIELKMMIEVLMEKVLEGQEPKTGHWEWVQYDSNPNIGNWHCSECRCIVVECVGKEEKGGIPLYNYCPNCGCKLSEISTGSESEDEE